MVLGTLIYIIIIIVVIIIIIALLQLLFGLFFVAPMGIESGDLEVFKGTIIALRPV
jgi:hypothetical protein